MANASRQILLPFQIGPDGGIAFTTDVVKQAIQRIETIIRTRIGERLMLPGFGSNASDAVWGLSDDMAVAELGLRIAEAVRTYETATVLRSVTPVSMDPTSGTVTLDIQFSVPPSAQVHSTLVAVGGSVIGTTNG